MQVAKEELKASAASRWADALPHSIPPLPPLYPNARVEPPSGHVVGLDFTDQQLDKARKLKDRDGFSQVEFVDASIDSLPFEDAAFDVVISNGVINLSFRKRRVLSEVFRVLGPGGLISITDIVSAKPLSQSIVNDPKLWAS